MNLLDSYLSNLDYGPTIGHLDYKIIGTVRWAVRAC